MKFNTQTLPTTHEGGTNAYVTPELDLVITMCGSLFKNTYYESIKTHVDRLNTLISKVDPLFAAKAAVWVRTQHGNRTVTHYVAALLANRISGKPWARPFFRSVTLRPDDMTEIAAAYAQIHGQTKVRLPKAMARAFADKLSQYSEYALAKYAMRRGNIKMVDLVRLTHPKPTPAIEKLVKGTLRNTDTWEAKLSAQQDAAQSWKELLQENKLGYLALIRNLRNIAKTEDPHLKELAIAALLNPHAIHTSLVWPYQIYKAYKAVRPIDEDLAKAAAKAVDISLANAPALDGHTCVVIDESGSMSASLDDHIDMLDMALLIGGAIARKNDADIIAFSDTARYINIPFTNITQFVEKYQPKFSSTYLYTAFAIMNKHYDNVIIISDMQFHDTEYQQEWVQTHQPRIVSFNLSTYGGAAINEHAMQFGGFKPELLQIATNTIINKVNNIQFS